MFNSIRLKLKQFFVHFLLSSLRGLILLKRHGGPILHAIVKPFFVTSLFLVRFVGIPGYRFLFWSRRLATHVLRPTKHRLLRVVTNRYTVHVIVVLLVMTVVIGNIRTREVRAETFGQRSILYSLLPQINRSPLRWTPVKIASLTTDIRSFG